MTNPSASMVIEAPPAAVYGILADYHAGHPRILPTPPFESLTVKSGGVGDGTVIEVAMRVLGRRQTFVATVSEPEPGRVLVETNDTGYVTTFTVEPHGAGGTHVTIETAPPQGRGLARTLERWLLHRMLVSVFRKELAILAEVAAERRAA